MFKAIKFLSLLSASLAATTIQTGTEGLRLVELDENTRIWVTEEEKMNLKEYGFDFMDITEYQDLGSFRVQSAVTYPKALKSQDQVKAIISTLTVDNLKAYLNKLTSFETRYYKSPTGAQSQQWIVSKIKEITSEFAPKSLQEHIEITEFKHSWGQNSIIVRIKGNNEKLGSVLISAHQDSIAYGGRSPGADDDGSGTVSILEAYRGIVAAGKRFERTVEFHWYAGEEVGLLGSQAVAKDYASRGANVYAQQQFDMTAWVKQGKKEVVGLITDYVSKDLTEYNKILIDGYLSIGWVESRCGYGCSDHAAWTKAGYPSSFTFETPFSDHNPYIHTPQDTIDHPEFSWTHVLEFSKLAVGFIVELGNTTDV